VTELKIPFEPIRLTTVRNCLAKYVASAKKELFLLNKTEQSQGLLFKDKDLSSKDKDCVVKDQDKDCILVLKDKD